MASTTASTPATQRWGKHYNLDIDDKYDFPGFENLPPGGEFKVHGETCTILEVVENRTFTHRPVYSVRDRDGNESLIACYYDNADFALWEGKKCTPGNMIAVRDTFQHYFMDGNRGFRVEDPSKVSFLQCTRARLHELNARLAPKSKACMSCDKANCTLACAKCQAAYCSTECQKTDWSSAHRKECKVVQQLRDWNEVEDWR